MNKYILWPWAIKNSIAILSWVALAVVFNKWWIALFGLLFMSGLKAVDGSYRVCDECGKHSPYADSHNEALNKAKEAGWVHFVDCDKDYCPHCQQIKSKEHWL